MKTVRTRTLASAAATCAAMAAVGCGPDGTWTERSDETALSSLQSSVDYDTSLAVANLVGDLYTQNVGSRDGVAHLTVACPRGGTAVITGRIVHDTRRAATVVDVAFAMTDCATHAANGDIAVTGTVHETGSFDETPHQALDDSADSLTMRGTIDDAPVDATCPLHVNVSTSTSPHFGGSICGRAL